VLDRVLRNAPDVLVVARGALQQRSQPRSLAALKELMKRGLGICVRHAERHDPGIAALAHGITTTRRS